MNEVDFEWPKALRALKAAAEDGTLEARTLYPREIKALCDLVGGAPLDDTPRAVAPGMTVTRHDEQRDRDAALGGDRRAAYYFIARFNNGRVWQCSLFSAWVWTCIADRQFQKTTGLHLKNIAHAVTSAKGPS